jgi:hypothetical protein
MRNFQPLFAAATKSLLEVNQFKNGLRRLLKIFARNLKDEAATPHHHETVHFLSRSTRQVSYAITNFYFDSQESEERLLQVDSLKIQSPDGEEAQSEDEPGDNEPASISFLTETIQFITESRAFEKLCRDLDSFVSRALINWHAIDIQWKNELNCAAPFAIRAARPHQVETSTKEDPGVINKVKISLEKFSGESWDWWPLKPPRHKLRPGKIRLTWTCVR